MNKVHYRYTDKVPDSQCVNTLQSSNQHISQNYKSTTKQIEDENSKTYKSKKFNIIKIRNIKGEK